MSRLDPVVVTATRTQSSLSDLPQTVTVISREDIEESKVDTVADLLRQVVGVEVLQSGGRGTSASVFIRGSESDEVLVLIDGVQVNSVTLGAFDFANLTPEGFDRVEVLRGGGGSLYGSEAVGGVINLITRRGAAPTSGSFSVAGGNGATDRETGVFSAATDLFRIAGSATHLGTAGFGPEVPVDDGGTVKRRQRRLRRHHRLAARRLHADRDRLAVRHPALREERRRPRQCQQLPRRARSRTRASNGDFYFAKLGWEDAPLRGPLVPPVGRVREGRPALRRPPDTGNTADTRSRIPSEIVQGDAQANYAWDWSLSTLGFQYTRKSADVFSFSSISEPQASTFDPSRQDFGVYGQEQIRLFDDQIVVLGSVRYDHDQQFGDVVSPTAAIAVRLPIEPWPGYWTGTRLRATYAEGFRAPTFNELFFPGFGNPDLGPERSSEWNTGVDLEFLDGRAVVYATYFDRRVIDDIVTVLVDPDTFTFAPVNLGRVDATGVETGIDVDLGAGFRCGGSYTYLGLSSAGGAGQPDAAAEQPDELVRELPHADRVRIGGRVPGARRRLLRRRSPGLRPADRRRGHQPAVHARRSRDRLRAAVDVAGSRLLAVRPGLEPARRELPGGARLPGAADQRASRGCGWPSSDRAAAAGSALCRGRRHDLGRDDVFSGFVGIVCVGAMVATPTARSRRGRARGRRGLAAGVRRRGAGGDTGGARRAQRRERAAARRRAPHRLARAVGDRDGVRARPG